MKSQPVQTKILYLITQGIWGGAQRYVFDLATHLPPNFEVCVAVGETNGQSDLQKALQATPAAQVKIFGLNHLVRSIRPLTDLRAIFELRQLIKDQSPDILHLNSSKAGIIGSLATWGLKNRPRVIYTVHGWVFLEPLPPLVRWTYKFLEKQTARFKDHFIILSEKEKKISLSLGIPETKLTLIKLGIDLPTFPSKSQARNKLLKKIQLSETPTKWIGTIANLFPTKGLDLLIAASKTILKTQPKLHFFIIGSGPAKSLLEKQIRQLKLSRTVHLVGNQTEAAKLLPAFDLFVLPSRKEGSPYTILEAQSAGIPIVATAVGGVSELLTHYPNSRLSAPNNITALTEAILAGLALKNSTNQKTATVRTAAEMTKDTLAIYG